MIDKPDPELAAGFDGQSDSRVILASGSPRRGLLLPLVCPVLTSLSPDTDETPRSGESAEALAVRLAESKLARARMMLGSNVGRTTLVSADTVVALDGEPFGKPLDASDAREMLSALAGRSHTVITAVGLGQTAERQTSDTRVTWVATEVVMRDIGHSEIERYIDRGEPFDKAGGYAIQDAELKPVDHMVGCFPNVVGLPLCVVRAMLTDQTLEGLFVPADPPCDLCRHASAVLNEHGFWAPTP